VRGTSSPARALTPQVLRQALSRRVRAGELGTGCRRAARARGSSTPARDKHNGWRASIRRGTAGRSGARCMRRGGCSCPRMRSGRSTTPRPQGRKGRTRNTAQPRPRCSRPPSRACRTSSAWSRAQHRGHTRQLGRGVSTCGHHRRGCGRRWRHSSALSRHTSAPSPHLSGTCT
jgi:hypothetical protein